MLRELKIRTKLLIIFGIAFAGIVYANVAIVAQMRSSNASIESQSRIMANQTILTDAVSCFGAIKYGFAVLDKAASKAPDASMERSISCDNGQFESALKNLAIFSEAARKIQRDYARLRELPGEVIRGYGEGDSEAGRKAMEKAYAVIPEIDAGLAGIARELDRESTSLSTNAFVQADRFGRFQILFLVFGLAGVGVAAAIIFLNIFRPIENIITTMVDASHDPRTARDHLMHHTGGVNEVDEVKLALNTLLLQVDEGFRRTGAAEQHSADAARQRDAIFNSVPDSLITVNGEGEIEAINVSAYSVFGYDRRTAKGLRIRDFFPSEEGERYMRSLRAYLGTGADDLVDSGTREMVGRKASGAEFPIELSVTSVAHDDGLISFVNVIRDITHRKDLERQLVQAQKMEALGSLSSGIAHEINTPTQYVRDNLKFMRDAFAAYDGFYHGVKTGGAAEELEKKLDLSFFSTEVPLALEQSLEGVGHISEIVGAIKGFSHPSTEDFSFVDINELLKNTVIVSRNQWKPFAHLDLKLDENMPPVPCIPGKLTQVVLNLIINAAHAIEEKGRGTEDPDGNVITVSSAASARAATIRISDSGCGISPENIDKIFNPFFTTKEVGKGTGQGLSISYDIIVGKHGGALRVESEPGKGATFIIELPMTHSDNKAA